MAKTDKVTPNSKANSVCKAIKEKSKTKNGKRLEILEGPLPVEGGYEVWVQLYDNDVEVRIDQHRVFINPPTQVTVDDRVGIDVETGQFIDRVVRSDPAEAFWAVVWESVLTTPNARGRRKR
jgi:hypothetical protein